MALTITNNVASLTAQNNLTRTSDKLKVSLERLSSGLRINRGADGPAALVISEEQRAQISGIQAAINNATKGVALVQTTEGALNEINSLLIKIRGLALDSANAAVNDANALAANQAEVSNSFATIDRIATTTQFGTKKVLDGTAGLIGTSNNTGNVRVLKISSTAGIGSYQVNVTTAAQQALVTAGSPQYGTLAQAETLTINGVQIDLATGLTQTQVRDQINSFTAQTGAVAEIFSNAGKQSNTAFAAAAVTTSTTAFTSGAAAATTATKLVSLDQHVGGAYAAADTIAYTVTKVDGTTANGTFTFVGANDTVGDLLTSIQTTFGAGYTVSVTRDGNITARNNTLGTTAAISIAFGTQTTASGGSINFGSFTNNGVTSSTAVGSTLGLNDLAQSNGKYGTGDVLQLSGTRSDGTTFTNVDLAVTASTRISDVVTGLQTQFGLGYTVSFSNGKFSVIDNKNANASAVAVSIVDKAGNVGTNTNFVAGTIATQSTALRVHSQSYGSAARISVQSTVSGSANSSGIGTGILSGTGVDVAGTIGGFTATGFGNVLIGNTSDKAQGIAVQVVGIDPAFDTQTVSGTNLAVITTVDNSLVFQIGPNSNQTASIAVDNVATSALGLGVAGVQFNNLGQITVNSQSGSQDALKVVDQAIIDISSLRGRLGAFQQNTLEATANNLRTSLENATAAESVIRDTDFAGETANFTKFQVLIQAGTTVLSSANQTALLVLGLLNPQR